MCWPLLASKELQHWNPSSKMDPCDLNQTHTWGQLGDRNEWSLLELPMGATEYLRALPPDPLSGTHCYAGKTMMATVSDQGF